MRYCLQHKCSRLSAVSVMYFVNESSVACKYVCLRVCVSVWFYMFVWVCISVCAFADVLCKISSALSAQHAFRFPVLTGKRGVSFCESWCFWRLPSRFLISNLQHGTISQSLKHCDSFDLSLGYYAQDEIYVDSWPSLDLRTCDNS